MSLFAGDQAAAISSNSGSKITRLRCFFSLITTLILSTLTASARRLKEIASVVREIISAGVGH